MTLGESQTYSASPCPSVNKRHWPGFQGPLLVAFFSSYPPLPNVLLFVKQFYFLNETCRCLMFGSTSVIPVNLFISVSSVHRTLLQYSRITVGYSSSPFVGWVNSVSPNYLFFETMYYTAFSSVQSLSRVRLFVTPWTVAHQASLSITNSWSPLKLMSIE